MYFQKCQKPIEAARARPSRVPPVWDFFRLENIPYYQSFITYIKEIIHKMMYTLKDHFRRAHPM